ncbi:hypothetical protein B0T10DRAFT_533095 [Thelonectria olida]|uniref:Uncharacterized protein n=1 Tax=Thelonectria olida TaxID=1576542 RepID=A0A9P8VT36_9HYPO|nr:hypothetical protein B0T10DRAFT_533095 [Thelonectria olida]
MTIDYSKWDNIDIESAPEVSPLSVPAPQAPAPTALQSGAPATAAPSGTPGSIQAVISAIMIKADHPVFSNYVPPVPGLIEIPLILRRVGTQSTYRADLDNQIATYLNINSESGFAPPAWQSYVGTVLVARKDEKPLLPQHLEGREAFEEWWEGYCEEQKEFRPGTGGENDPDDWRAVRSRYEM